jgi:hypothetical protein
MLSARRVFVRLPIMRACVPTVRLFSWHIARMPVQQQRCDSGVFPLRWLSTGREAVDYHTRSDTFLGDLFDQLSALEDFNIPQFELDYSVRASQRRAHASHIDTH